MESNVINHADRLHAKFSPSSLENRELCPGWESDNKASIYADAGEACHEATEAKLNGNDDLQKNLPKDLAYFVEEVYQYTAPRIAGAEKIVSEKRLFHDHPLLKTLAHGTPDLYAVTGDAAQLIDFKFGKRPVTKAEFNLQGWAYAIALWDNELTVNTITVHFVAPRVPDGTSDFTFDRSKDYERMLIRVLFTVSRANLPEEEREKLHKPSYDACIYCCRKATCRDFEELALTNIPDELDESFFTTINFLKTKEQFDKDSLRYQYDFAKATEDWVKQKLDFIKQKALEGNEVDGYELRFTKGRTTVQPVARVLRAGVDLPIDKVLEVATIPLVELKKLYTSSVSTSEKTDKEKELMDKLSRGDALKSGEESCYLYKVNEKQ